MEVAKSCSLSHALGCHRNQKCNFVSNTVMKNVVINCEKDNVNPDTYLVLTSCITLLCVPKFLLFGCRYSVENAYLEEKEDTCNALGEISENSG